MHAKPAMKLMVLFSTVLFCHQVAAFENFFNSRTPYPSGCVTYFMYQGIYPGGAQILVQGPIIINSTTQTGAVTAQMTIYRTGCANDSRSVLWLELEIEDDGDGVAEYGVVPQFSAIVGPDEFPLRPTEEPSGWVSNDSGIALAEGTMRYYVLDVPTPFSTGFDPGFFFIPSLYNGAFTLFIDNQDTDSDYTAEIGAYDGTLSPSIMPLNGRLSGIWVVLGASDQGFVISFSEIPGNDTEGLIFFSWYTFDDTGTNVWLVGNGNYTIGDGSITFNLELVTDGEFMGGKTATRIPAGSVTILARHCNLLEMFYDLSPVGLGTATVEVVRLAGIETSSFTCMDFEDSSS